MLISCIRAELMKLRRALIWAAFVILPGISALIGCINYRMNLGIITPGWGNLWTQQTLFVCSSCRRSSARAAPSSGAWSIRVPTGTSS
ncbi:hypothetical protein [Bifidobacterium pullorum]|uniref:hypothetical protein n=1 Tax=Bifidobacterium pullorum TaxID=78448 RepID=UPI00195EDE54|nr:hypothetical protein [Bifidobacterium pullorum]